MSQGTLTRRSFITVLGGAGAYLTIGCYLPPAKSGEPSNASEVAFEANAFITIGPDGSATITISKSEMGQGVRTSLAMAAAEELDIDWSKVKVANAEGDGRKYGGQGTGGSSSTRGTHQRMRQMGAAARSMLVAAAAKTWSVEPSACRTESGKVIHPDGKQTFGYGELASKAVGIPAPAASEIKLKSPAEFKIVGKPTLRVDSTAIVKGAATFGIDVRRPGMVYATLVRPAEFGGSVDSLDATKAKKLAGVLDVFQAAGGVVVIANNSWTAMRARDLLQIKWKAGPNPTASSDSIRSALKASLGTHPDIPPGAKVVEATFELPYLAHSTMEPMNAVASVTDDSCEVWCGSQSPDSARSQIARQLGIPAEKIRVNNTLLGGGFGRRSNNDFVLQAVEIAKKVGKPVKLLWTKEDDIQHDWYRPICHHVLKGAVQGADPVFFSHLMAEAGMGAQAAQHSNMGLPYDIPATMTYSSIQTAVPTWFWRSVEHSQINVVNECFIDALAFAAGTDPLEFRRKRIRDPRLRKVLDLVAEKSGWGKPLPKGSGKGVACLQAYGSYAAHVVEVTVKGDDIRVNRVVAAVDCGLVVNPKGVEAQMIGAIGDGIATALHAAITIKDGAVEQSNWHDYEWLRFDRAPKVEVFLAGEGEVPGGMGEVGYPGVPSAVANAVFNATGKRVRKFPMKVSELV